MKRPCVAVIGATTALEVVSKHFTEATIGSTDVDIASEVKRLLTAPYFRLTISKDEVGVELCGAMKNVIAIAAGVSDGLNLGDNTKSAVLRLGFWEMFQLMKELFPNRGVQGVTLEESCGVAELIVCMSHRSDKLPALGSDMDLMNIILGKSLATRRRLSEGSVTGDLQHPVTFVDGAEYAHVIYNILKARNRLDNYPLFVAVHEMCQGLLSPHHFLDRLRSHPVHR
ncbi:Glycerol-3-phosphate dehydrogenase [NAD(+)] [Fasciola gigantica]|uniref:glycerol-3-phosphate dehydrogenase (NAD(+)) n=1 Tax=Fasciola gigantica TaxID=46835 RepID=A0A504YKC4_FASGI|nr:Glycerol-3-phosphate dehydrogenase [NAD(+)] [Fasciola gigantica]